MQKPEPGTHILSLYRNVYVSARTKDTEWQKCVPPLCYAWATFLSSDSYTRRARKERRCLAAKRDLLFQVPICNAWAYVFLIMAQRSRILSCNTTFFCVFWSTSSTVKTEINLFQTGDNLWLSDPIVLQLPEYASHMWPRFFQTLLPCNRS